MNSDPMRALIKRWRSDAAQYQRQVEEARVRGTPYDQMLSMTTALRQCAQDLERVLDAGPETKADLFAPTK